uniref:Putative nuclease HARBI1 n=1 Tax=Crassostrea virginica TaxID=6565 RepID=A0A8B8BXF5_CRAVI|nr:putative nuclease HARBI1 [Crassostrea virginica]
MAAVLYLADDEIERECKRMRVFRDRNNPLEVLNDIEVIERYRLPRNVLIRLVELVREDVERPTKRSHSLSALTQVLVTVRYLAKGSFFSECGDLHGLSRPSVSRCIEGVTKSICQRLDNIHFPIGNDAVRTKHDFYQIAGFPNVLGAVDGSLIPIIAPKNNEPEYVCRKGFHAINIQVVADASLRFTNIVCKWPGSVHDAFIFANSALKDQMETRNDGWLLGDSAYALKKYMMTSKSNPSDQGEENYNAAHSRTRVVVERALGVCKSRFRCIHKSGGMLLFSPQKSVQIITAVAKLHNLCMDLKVPVMEGDITVNMPDPMVHQHYAEEANADRNGQTIRQQSIERFATL